MSAYSCLTHNITKFGLKGGKPDFLHASPAFYNQLMEELFPEGFARDNIFKIRYPSGSVLLVCDEDLLDQRGYLADSLTGVVWNF
jgi:hypothetical protein